MNHPVPAGRWFDAVWLVAVGVLSSAWCLTAHPHLSATFDEPCHMERGLYGWRTGSMKPLMSAGCMPLSVDVQTLPLYVWEQYRGTPHDPKADLTELLRVARPANLLFWWLLLLYALRLGRAVGGPWAGRLACGLVAADPNLVAHATLATTDISITATTLMAVFHFHAGRDGGWGRRVFVPGLCYGVAVLAKASALAFVPIGFLVVGLFHIRRGARGKGQGARSEGGQSSPLAPSSSPLLPRPLPLLVRDLVHIVLIGSVLVFAYCGCDWTTERTFVEWAHQLPDGRLQDVMVPVSENLRIFTNAGEALAQQIKHNIRGHGSYLHGDWHPRACWYYFPYALTVKLPLPTLALLAVAALRWRAWFGNPVGWLAVALLLFSLNCRVQIGIRLIFPLVAMLYVAAAVSLASGPPSRLRIGFALAVLVLNAVTTATVWPHGMRFANELYGGPDNGYKALSDSNYDWGQGLPDLARETGPGKPPLAVWYYGMDDAAARPPFRLMPLHAGTVRTPDEVKRLVGDARLAVSTTILYGNPSQTPAAKAAVEYLKGQTPVARTATFFIYDLRDQPVRPPAVTAMNR